MSFREGSSQNFERDSFRKNLLELKDVMKSNSKFTSLKRLTQTELMKKKRTLKQIDNIDFGSGVKKLQCQFKDYVKQRDSNFDIQFGADCLLPAARPRTKQVRFRDRVSIEQRKQSITLLGVDWGQSSKENHNKESLLPSNHEDSIEPFHAILKSKFLNLPMTSRRRAPESIKVVSDLLNLPIQSKNTIISELRCFMCHYPEYHSPLFSRNSINQGKQSLKDLDKISIESFETPENSEIFFRYDTFGVFLKTLSEANYDSHQLINSYESMLKKYDYPITIRLMLYYLGSYLYQLNSMYSRAEDILKQMLNELLKYKLFEFIGIYLMLMIKLKCNLLEWETATEYLTKLLAYSWAYKMDNLEIWVYFEMSRCYFFMNLIEESQYYQQRSEMSICEPNNSVYKFLIAKEYKLEVEQMRSQHRSFNLNNKIAICELMKLPDKSENHFKGKQTFKLQSQIKNINEYCKIKHVKNLLNRMNSHQSLSHRNILSESTNSLSSSQKYLAGNPLLRTHESGLKNLNVYFRSNSKGKSLIGKNRQPKLYTCENSHKNIQVLRELCRNILLQMKWFVPINIQQNS